MLTRQQYPQYFVETERGIVQSDQNHYRVDFL